MGARVELVADAAMTSRWRRRRLCVLACGGDHPASLRSVSAAGAFLQTDVRPALGEAAVLHHPEAGAIGGTVCALHVDGVALRFKGDEAAMAFALAAISADMSQPS